MFLFKNGQAVLISNHVQGFFFRIFAKFEFSFYLKYINIRKYLTALFTFRLAAHHLILTLLSKLSSA